MDLTLFNSVKTKFHIFFIVGFCIIFLSSCVPYRKLEYLQEKNQEMAYQSSYEDHVLKSYDELYIQISSITDETTNVFAANAGVGSASQTGASLMSQVIDRDGYVEIPVLGKIQAKGKTLAEFKSFLKESLINVLNQPTIEVKLVNKFYSVVGEVKATGNFQYSQDKLTIFDALSKAGDIGLYGNRKKVLVIRNVDGVNKIREINLLKADILKSDYYYIQPGDIIYVKPLKIKVLGIGESPYTIILTLITTTALIINYTNN